MNVMLHDTREMRLQMELRLLRTKFKIKRIAWITKWAQCNQREGSFKYGRDGVRVKG